MASEINIIKTESNHLVESMNFQYQSNNSTRKNNKNKRNKNGLKENKENISSFSNVYIKDKERFNKLKIILQKQPIKYKKIKNNIDKNIIIDLNSYNSASFRIFEPDSFNNTSITYSKHKNKALIVNHITNQNKKNAEKKKKTYLNKEQMKKPNDSNILNSSISFSNNRNLNFLSKFKTDIKNIALNKAYSNNKNTFDNSKLPYIKYKKLSQASENNKLENNNNNKYNQLGQYYFSPPKSEISKNLEKSTVLKKSCINLTDRRNNLDFRLTFINPDDFKIIKQIGYGSFGKIYKTLNIRNDLKYALKVINNNLDNILYHQEKVRLIMDFEKKIKCDGLIKIYGDYYHKKRNQYFYYEVLELADRDWEQEILLRRKKCQYYPEHELIKILFGLVKTLSLLQKNHITHRDIKLQNILLLDNTYKICDFGEARKLSQKGIIVQPVRGSELFMSPIQFFGLENKLDYVQHNTYKSDVFSLGMCILFAANLSDDCLYDIRELTDMKEIENILMSYLRRRYSIKFIHLLLIILEFEEKNRPDFISLEQIISNSFKKVI